MCRSPISWTLLADSTGWPLVHRIPATTESYHPQYPVGATNFSCRLLRALHVGLHLAAQNRQYHQCHYQYHSAYSDGWLAHGRDLCRSPSITGCMGDSFVGHSPHSQPATLMAVRLQWGLGRWLTRLPTVPLWGV